MPSRPLGPLLPGSSLRDHPPPYRPRSWSKDLHMSPVTAMLLALLFILERVVAMPRLPLQEAAEKTLCPFKYRKDVLETRIPRVIHKVECLGSDSAKDVVYVDSSGQFNKTCTCTEIYTNLSVVYNHHHSGPVVNEIRYPIGCACVNPTSLPMRRIHADVVDR